MLGATLERRGYRLTIDPARFLVGDAASYDYGKELIDLVYSEDVFEHIPPDGLEKLVPRIASQLSPRGIALITPNIFTGITGGHLIEWYPHKVKQEIARKSEPWEHLRKRRYTADTYLNRLPRSAYRELFGRYFEILEEKVMEPELGRCWLTPEAKAELADWEDEELFSNRVRFVLRSKARG